MQPFHFQLFFIHTVTKTYFFQKYKLKTNTTNSIFIFYNFIRKHNRLFISISLSNNYNSIYYFFRNFAALYPLETYIII